jgi:hypothetical protein
LKEAWEMRRLILGLMLFTFSLAGEILQGPFAIKGNYLYAKDKLVGTLAKSVAIIKIDGSAVNLESLQFARAVEIKKDPAGNIIQIRILGWEY